LQSNFSSQRSISKLLLPLSAFVAALLVIGLSDSFGIIADPAKPVAKPETEQLDVEKDELKFGFIKLTDCAPLVVAKEKGFFDDEGLQVEVIAQPNWKQLLDNVINGELDGAHMLSGQPIAATIGFGTKAHIVTAYTLDLNGNGITVSNDVWSAMVENDPSLDTPTPKHPITAVPLKPVVQDKLDSGEKLQMGMVFPVSTHNYEIRYWLASAGIHPGMYTSEDIKGFTDAQVELSVTPPPQMPSALESGTISGYCVGEPWNQQAVSKGIGVPVTTNYDIWKNNPEKVFGVTKAWADENPNTHIAVVKALMRAGKWLDETDASGTLINREEACRMLAKPNYVGADFDVIKNSMTGFFFFQNTEPKPASWYDETAKSVYLPAVYLDAAKRLMAEGHIAEADIPWDSDGYRPPSHDFIDGIEYDGKKPLEYLQKHGIGNQN